MTDPILQNISKIKSNRIILLGCLFLVIYLFNINITSANTGINPQIPYSGTIVKNDGTVLDGTYRAKLLIYPNASPIVGETALYEEIRNGIQTYSGIVSPSLPINDGKFDILLGSQNTSGISSLNDDSLWLELQLDIDNNGSYEEIFSPRRRIGSALSAINSMRLVANGGVSTNTLSLDVSGNVIATSLGGAVPNASTPGGFDRVLLANSSGQFSQVSLSSLTSGNLTTTTGWALAGNSTTDAWNGTTGSRLGTTSAQPLVLATTNATAQDIRFFTGANGANERMRILGNGNIGIGTIAPNAKLNINTDSLGATVSDTSGISLTNSTVAISGTQQISPALRWSGSGFATTPGAALNTSFISYLQPVQGTTAPSSNLIFASSINNSAYTTRLTLSSAGALTVGAGLSATTGAFSSTLTNTRNALVTTSTDGIITTNTTASTAVVPVQVSPRIRLSGTAWNTTATASSNTINWSIENVPISGAIPSSSLRFNFDRNGTGYSNVFSLLSGGNLGLGVLNPTARLNLAAGTASANTSPLKFTAGTNLTTPEAGAVEWNGTNLFLTTSGNVRQTINQGLTAISTLDFPSTNSAAYSDLTVTVTGALDGDVVTLGIPNASVPAANSNFTAWVSAANIVTIRFNNNSGVSQDPASGSFKVFVTKF